MNEPKKLEQLWGDFLEGEWTDASLRELKELLDDAESEKKAVQCTSNIQYFAHMV